MLVLNEWRYCLRQPLVWLSMLLMPAFALMLSVGIETGSEALSIQLALTQFTLLMLTLPIALGALSPMVFLRDKNAQMHELVYASPVSFKARWGVRFFSLVSLVCLLFTLSLAVVLTVYSLKHGIQTAFFKITVLNFLSVFIPAITLVTALAMWLCVRWQSSLLTYTFFALAGVVYLVLASMTGSPVLAGSSVISDSFYRAMLWLDPYGITVLIDQIKSDEAYTHVALLINRLAYLTLALGLVFIALKNGVSDIDGQAKTGQRAGSTKGFFRRDRVKRASTIWVPQSAFFQLVALPLKSVLSQRITLVVLLGWPVLVFNEVLAGLNYIEPMSVVAANSIDALNRVAFDVLPVFAALFLALWSWRICWLNKDRHIAELIAAAPVANWQILLSQIVVLWVLLAGIIGLTFTASSLAEWLAGSDWMFSHYLKQLVLSLLPLMLLGALFTCIHHLCRTSLMAGTIIGLILLVKFTPITTALGLTHTLWNIADTPLQEPDNFWGYRASLSVYLPYLSVWGLVCLSVLLTACHRSHRGTGLAQASFSRMPKSAVFFIGVGLAAMVSLHNGLISEKPLLSSDKREAWKAEYERAYGEWQHRPQPTIAHLNAQVDIYPQQHRAEFRLDYTLENRTEEPIKQILVGRYGNYAVPGFELDGKRISPTHCYLNQAVYSLASPLMPGERRVLSTAFDYQQPKFWPLRTHQVINPEFSYLRAQPLLPTIGYQPGYQLQDAQLRAQHGLEEESQTSPSILFADAGDTQGRYDWYPMTKQISTSQDQHAVSQGMLTRHWQEGDRAYFEFRTQTPIRAIGAWLSLPYAPETKTVAGVQTQLFAPESNQASTINHKAVADTLAWMAQNIAPYRGKQLSLVVTPDLGYTGYALPQIMLVSHGVSLRAKPDSDAGFDQRYRRAVHETAHQWFGHDLGNGVVQDSAFLVESMAKYVELVMLEKHYGRDTMLALVEHEQQRYDRAERNNFRPAVALVDATQSHDMYSRATLVFSQLRDALGDEVITAALKELWRQHEYPNAPATSMDFVRELIEQAPQAHHQTINDLLLTAGK